MVLAILVEVVKIFQSNKLGKICQTKIEVNSQKHQDNLSNKLRFIFQNMRIILAKFFNKIRVIFQNIRIILAKFVEVYRGETDLMCRGLSTPRDIILIERQS